jgi:hypothetical protein
LWFKRRRSVEGTKEGIVWLKRFDEGGRWSDGKVVVEKEFKVERKEGVLTKVEGRDRIDRTQS